VPVAGWIRADQIEIDSVSAGDGVQYVATSAVVYEGP
jgi:hypothetical protein